jgi:hypothetical protein
MPKKQLVAEALIDLHRRLSTLPTRSHERRMIMEETANLYGVSEQTLYRALAHLLVFFLCRRNSRGLPTETARIKRCTCSIRSICFLMACLNCSVAPQGPVTVRGFEA